MEPSELNLPESGTASRMKKTMPLMILVALLLAALLAYETAEPQAARQFLLQVDIFGLSDTATLENKRVSMIMTLPITYERKQALVGQKIFMGATPDMVRLALGPPKLQIERPISAEGPPTIWHYYLPGESRPTVLEFEQNTLVKAYKGSAIDVE